MQPRILLILLFFQGVNGVFGQNVIPNSDFEDWINIDTFTAERPNYWRTDSGAIFLSRGYKSPILKSNDCKSGSSAVGLQFNEINQRLIGDTIRCTFIFKGRPNSLVGFYKFSKFSLSMPMVEINMYARDSNSIFYKLASSQIFLSASTDWRSFFSPIQYYAADISYKAEIKLYAPNNYSLSDSNLIVLFDQFSFSAFNNLEPSIENSISIFPNPVIDFISFEGIDVLAQFELINMQGEVVFKCKVIDKKVDLTLLPAGVYCWTIFNGDRLMHGKIVKK